MYFNALFMFIFLKCLSLISSQTEAPNFEVDIQPYKNHGIVKIRYEKTTVFYPICDSNFDDNAANVVCRQQNFGGGIKLQPGSFGAVKSSRFVLPGLKCNGTEKSLSECPIDKTTTSCYGDIGLGVSYAAVVCYKTENGTFNNSFTYALGNTEYSVGAVVIDRYGIKGGVCSDYWTIQNSVSFCKDVFPKKPIGIPYILKDMPISMYHFSKITCLQNSASFDDCQYATKFKPCDSGYFKTGYAGVMCYDKDNKPDIRLTGTGSSTMKGRVELNYNGEWGTICDFYMTRRSEQAANVICRMLNFNFGKIVKNHKFGGGRGPVYLQDPECVGSETSIYQCQNSDWQMPQNQTCKNHNNDLAVRCFDTVRLTKENSAEKFTTGLVQIYDKTIKNWLFVCGQSLVVKPLVSLICNKLGFKNGSAISGDLIQTYRYDFQQQMMNILCPSNAKSIENCTASQSFWCGSFAAVSCYDSILDIYGPKTLVRTYGSQYSIGKLQVSLHGLTGYVCTVGFDDRDASRFCRDLGYSGGLRAFSTKLGSDDTTSFLLSGLVCDNSSTDFYSCPRSSGACYLKSNAATAYCYFQEPELKIVGKSKSEGQVRLKIENKWGGICLGSALSRRYQARQVCRGLGFIDGESVPVNITQSANLPMWFADHACHYYGITGVLGCNFSSFAASKCSDGPLFVKCQSSVKIGKSTYFGPLQIHVTGYYRLVCDVNFTNVEASTVCRHNHYLNGIALTGSAFGYRSTYMIAISDFKCPLMGSNVNKCAKRLYARCMSKMYASVVCSNDPPPGKNDYSLSLESTAYGAVKIKYYNYEGAICGAFFTHKDATVICREMGFSSGISYRTGNRYGYGMWVKRLNCNGKETSIKDCPRTAWGVVGGCGYSVAAVMCYKADEQYGVRLVGSPGSKPYEGRVTFRVSGSWATICKIGMTDKEATVVCRERKYNAGRVVEGRNYGDYSGEHILYGVTCKGNEKRIIDCRNYGFAKSGSCASHANDATIFCYMSVRLNGGTHYNYGRIEVLLPNNVWTYLTDKSIDRMGARVACRSMGFSDGLVQCCSPYKRIYKKVPQNLQKYMCSGQEKFLIQCSSVNLTTTYKQQANVYCTDEIIEKGKFEFGKPKSGYYGPFEVTQAKITSYLCPYQWTDKAANVYCKQQGFKSGGVARFSTAVMTKPYFPGVISCKGNEKKLRDCTITQNSVKISCEIQSTPSLRLASVGGVLCFNKDPIKFKLTHKIGNLQGWAEIMYDGKPFAVCMRGSNSFKRHLAAAAFCRNIGFIDGYSNKTGSPTVSKPALLFNVNCKGMESSILHCQHQLFTNLTCPESEILTVICYRKVRLVRGNESFGMVQINTGGNLYWRTVCGDDFTNIDATVACKPDYKYGLSLCCGAFGYNLIPVERTKISCTGTETSLVDCPFENAKPKSVCGRDRYAAVLCYNQNLPKKYERIFLRYPYYSGSVIIQYMGLNGSICADGWTDKEAMVACRELNFPGGEKYIHFREKYVFHKNYGPYWASTVKCKGTENSLKDCQMNLGDIGKCPSHHHAGLLCYTKSGIDFRLAGSSYAREGRVEARIENKWGSICHLFWDWRESRVLCRMLGYIDGISVTTKYSGSTDTMWQPRYRCSGKEKHLKDCPHSGWVPSLSTSCVSVGTVCFNEVALQTGHLATHGPLLLRVKESWKLACDDGFNDYSAKLVCRSLGAHVDGRAVCCSAYGTNKFRQNYAVDNTHTIACTGTESTITECIRKNRCKSKTYASVMCFNTTDPDESLKFHIDKKLGNRGQVIVQQFGIQGRICSQKWDDRDAMVVCRYSGYQNGIAYSHHTLWELFDPYQRGPFLVGQLHCSGSEKSLGFCSRKDRLNLGDCSNADVAGVLCYNDTGIKYRLIPDDKNTPYKGRVEVGVDNVWGTVCNTLWDDRDATVFCKTIGRGGGIAVSPRPGNRSQPIWLSHLLCNGNESSLHQCKHRGFNETTPTVILVHRTTGQQITIRQCTNHYTDAGVRCYGTVRLSLGLDRSMGAVETYDESEKRWLTVCDSTFDNNAAALVCKELKYAYGYHIPFSAFQNRTQLGPSLITYNCPSTANDLGSCSRKKESQKCLHYASVHCTMKPSRIENAMRLSVDQYSGSYYGAVEVRIGSVWGRICSDSWSIDNTRVVCRQLGFNGGVTYTHVWNSLNPILMRNVSCQGDENNLFNCKYDKYSSEFCHHRQVPVGVLCYNDSEPVLKLVGGNTNYVGHLMYTFNNQDGRICNLNWDTREAAVACRQLGYMDGYTNLYFPVDQLPDKIWVNSFRCTGDESTLLTCINSGWNSTYLGSQCRTKETTATVACFTHKMVISKVRLMTKDSPSLSEGRVEVYVEGPNLWGTICDDNWDDRDATVVCRMLGFSRGEASQRASHGIGAGPIWTSEVNCSGSEPDIQRCKFERLGISKCRHNEDAGVYCYGAKTTPTVVSPSVSTSSTPETASTVPVVTTTSTRAVHSPNTGIIAGVVVAVLIVVVIAVVVVIVFIMYRRRAGLFTHKQLEEEKVSYNANSSSIVVTSSDSEFVNPNFVFRNEDRSSLPDYSEVVSDPSMYTTWDTSVKPSKTGSSAVNPMYDSSFGKNQSHA